MAGAKQPARAAAARPAKASKPPVPAEVPAVREPSKRSRQLTEKAAAEEQAGAKGRKVPAPGSPESAPPSDRSDRLRRSAAASHPVAADGVPPPKAQRTLVPASGAPVGVAQAPQGGGGLDQVAEEASEPEEEEDEEATPTHPPTA
jgi:hypothetical protein